MTSGTVIVVLPMGGCLGDPDAQRLPLRCRQRGTAVMLALVALLVAKRFGYDTFFVRENRAGGRTGQGRLATGLGLAVSSGSSAMLSLAPWGPSEGR